MFNNMKNKIREKTGADLPKFTANSTSSLFGKKSNQHSRQSSQGSINSAISDLSCKEENESKSSANFVVKSAVVVNDDTTQTTDDAETKAPDVDFVAKLAAKEAEWREKEKRYVADLLKQTKELQEALSLVEEFKTKFQRCQEEKEELEEYQKREITKIKQLVSDNDNVQFQELNDRLEVLMKENEALRLSNEECRRIFDESLSRESNKNAALNVEMVRMKEYSQELAIALQKEKDVKDKTLLRNAEISQLVQFAEQELKQQQLQNEDLFKKIAALEEQLETSQQNLKTLQTSNNTVNERKLAETIKELENEIADKNKSIRILQQNLQDVKKTFQDELKNSASATTVASNVNSNFSSSYNDNAAVSAAAAADQINDYESAEDDINFKYMKHVLIKFLTSSEYEAQQLTKAVATLLKLNSEEERLIKDTLEWRSSWFGSKPRVKLHYNPS